MEIEVDLTPGDLARAMKDEDPETIVEFIRDFLDHEFNKASSNDLSEWLINFLQEDINFRKDIVAREESYLADLQKHCNTPLDSGTQS